MFRTVALCLALVALFTPMANAALKLTKKSEMLNAKQVSNPHPDKGDISLPMPGGLTMVFRSVCIPATGYMDAQETRLGVAAGTGGAATDMTGSGSYMDHSREVLMSAPYEPANFPQGWGKDVLDTLLADPACSPAKGGLRPFVYFIGKYEVSRAQWRSVMTHAGKSGPFTFVADDYLPQTSISWFESLEFTRLYTEWLLANHPQVLPVFALEKDRPSFIRLPTEDEWEFAARGGHKVDPAERARTSLHPVPAGEDIKNYISARAFDPALSTKPAPIGSRKPNPLMLYDMLGNAAEMVFSSFQLVASNRLIGGYGGFVIKGGSWLAENLADLHPGRRLEAAFYLENKALVRTDTGFRLSLGSILSPKDRWKSLSAEWQERSKPYAAQGGAEHDVRVKIQEAEKELENSQLRQLFVEAEKRAQSARATAGKQREKTEILTKDAEARVREAESRMRQMEADSAQSSKALLEQMRAAASASEKRVKDVLREAESVAALYHQKVNESEERMMRETVLGALFSLETATNYAVRARSVVHSIDTYKIALGSKEIDESQRKDILEKKSSMEKTVKDYIDGIMSALFYYKNMTETMLSFSSERLSPQIEKVSLQFSDVSNGFSRNMARRAAALRRHLERTTQKSMTERDILKDILPASIFQKIEAYF